MRSVDCWWKAKHFKLTKRKLKEWWHNKSNKMPPLCVRRRRKVWESIPRLSLSLSLSGPEGTCQFHAPPMFSKALFIIQHKSSYIKPYQKCQHRSAVKPCSLHAIYLIDELSERDLTLPGIVWKKILYSSPGRGLRLHLLHLLLLLPAAAG